MVAVGLAVPIAVLTGVLFVAGKGTETTITAVVSVVVGACGAAATLISGPAERRDAGDRERAFRVSTSLLLILTCLGLVFLGYKTYMYYLHTYTVHPKVKPPGDRDQMVPGGTRQLVPGESATLSVSIPAPRRRLKIRFGWEDGKDRIGGCALDARLTVYGDYGYPREPVVSEGIHGDVEVDLGAGRENARLRVRLESADQGCQGTLYVKHAKAFGYR